MLAHNAHRGDMLKSPRILRIILISVIAVILLFTSLAYYGPSAHGSFLSTKIANATLGFGAIYVVSGPGSPRRGRLQEAAAVTEVDLTIPEQTQWSDEDVADFRIEDENGSDVGEGSIKAWLSHRLVLEAFLRSGAETALIIEDDVDWDIRLRVQQVPLAQRAMQQMFNTSAREAAEHPYGASSNWDLIYLGHCGDYFRPVDQGIGIGHHHPAHLQGVQHVIYLDDSVSYFTDLHPFTASMLGALRVPERHRLIHQSKFPLCSFGYAVTRKGAKIVLEQVAQAKEELTRAPAFDVALLNGCTRDKVLNCYSVQPELFHHMEG